MITTIASLVMMIAAVVAAFACVITVVGFMQLTANRGHSYFHLVIPLILLTTALTIALSGRSIELNASQLAVEGMTKNSLATWMQRVSTIIILAASVERIIYHLTQKKTLLGFAPALTISFIFYWTGSIAAPMVLSAYPAFSHDAIYTLVIGLAALLLSQEESEATLLTARNALFIFLGAGYLMIPVNYKVVLDTEYTQGLIHGIPRFAGLAPHAVIHGMLAQLALLCLWAYPYQSRWLNRAAWALGLLTFFLAQSKTAWISFFFCAIAIWICQNGAALKQKLSDPMRPQLGIALTLGALALLVFGAADILFGNLGSKVDHFLNSDSGTQLTSLTGRDIIWAVAYQEWLRHPLFGYGPNFLDATYRMAIGLPNATHGHNQFMDMLPRAGLAGAIPLTFYIFVMLGLSIRHAVASRGLTLALFLALGLRAISEVPLSLGGYGPEFAGHLLLLVLLPAYSAIKQRQSTSHNIETADVAFTSPSTQV